MLSKNKAQQNLTGQGSIIIVNQIRTFVSIREIRV